MMILIFVNCVHVTYFMLIPVNNFLKLIQNNKAIVYFYSPTVLSILPFVLCLQEMVM